MDSNMRTRNKKTEVNTSVNLVLTLAQTGRHVANGKYGL